MTKSRRIGLNATCFNNRPSGARQRFIGLYGALMRLRPQDHFIIYEPRDVRVTDWFDLPNVEARVTPLPSVGRWPRLIGGLRYWPETLRRDRLDIFEQFHMPGARRPRCPALLTTHDIAVSREGSLWQLAERLAMPRLLARNDTVIAVSDQVAGDIARTAPGVPVARLHNGIDLAEWTGPDRSDRDRVLLAVGHFEARKNYGRLVEAFAALRARDPSLQLVIAGRDSGALAEIRALRDRLGVTRAVDLQTDATDEDLRGLYRRCLLFVFPSTYEGFGIPLLEAMASGAPMAISDLPVFREVAGNAAAYFDPFDPAAIASVLDELITKADKRERLAELGLSRVTAFDYAALARQLEALHDRLLLAGK